MIFGQKSPFNMVSEDGGRPDTLTDTQSDIAKCILNHPGGRCSENSRKLKLYNDNDLLVFFKFFFYLIYY